MAEIDSSHSRGRKNGTGVKKSKKLSTRIDLTSMVDLGFLLISFFMMTTTLAKPKTMEINMPYKDPLVIVPPTDTKASATITLLPGSGHNIYYYKGIDDGASYKFASFTAQKGIRAIIQQKKHEVDSLKRSGYLRPVDQTTVLIKPDTSSTYSDLVNILDEMSINGIETYAIIDISGEEQQRIKAAEPGR